MTPAASGGRRPEIPQGPFLVCGLARSGQSVARRLARLGQQVIAVDAASPEGAAGLSEEGVEVHLDAAGEDLVSRVRTVVKSPGVPREAPAVRAAMSAGTPVVGELEIGWRLCDSPVIAVTGTNGKTTVTEMVGHILRAQGTDVAVAGNVGRPISDVGVGSPCPGQLVVEASSFQLEDCDGFSPEIAVFLNISPDHLDRHGTMESYRAAKLKIFDRQLPGDVAIVPEGEDSADAGGEAKRVTFGGEEAEAAVVGGAITWRGEEIVPEGALPVPGRHNLLNAAAAAAACIEAGTPPAIAGSALSDFPGVAHRLEEVAVVGGVRWLNDSKATNVGSALTALASVAGPVRLIAGGQGKGQDFSELARGLPGACTGVHLIGEAAVEMAEALAVSGVDCQVDGTLESAVAAAASLARSGETVLLSPACASFDQFRDFEARGTAFAALVRELAR